MTTYYSDAVTSGYSPELTKAGVRLTRSAKYTPSAVLSTGDVIQMIPIPKDAMILDMTYQIKAGAFNSDATIDIGDGDDADRFFDGVSTSTAVVKTLRANGENAGVHYQYTAADTIDAKVLSSGLTTNASIYLTVDYKLISTIDDEDW